MSEIVLLPSPLLGPATWAPVTRWLRSRDLGVTVVAYDGRPPTPALVLESVLRAADGLDDVVLVPHSNAGLFAPRLAELLDVRATVFVDAALPTGGPDTPLAPEGFLGFLTGLADDDGLLPPWSQWWPSLEGVFPSAEVARNVQAQEQRLPLDYFHQRVPVPAGWAARLCAYLAFGATYDEEQRQAAAHGWPVKVLDGGHLHQLHDPAGVGGAVLELVSVLRG